MNGVTCCWLQYLERFFGIRLSWIQLCYRWIVDSWQRSTVTDGSVNTIPHMTCFRGAKVCTKWLQGKVMMNWHSMTTRWEFGTRIGKFRKVDWNGWVLRWLRDCRGNVAGTGRTDVLWLSSWSIASHGQCCSERICRRVGVVKVKSLEVRTLWLQQVVKAKALTLKTGKLLDIELTLVRRHWLLDHWVYSETWTDWWTRMLWTIFFVEYNQLRFLLVNLGCSEQQRWKCWNGRWMRLQGTIWSRQGVKKMMGGLWVRTAVCYVCELAPGLGQVEVIMTLCEPSWNPRFCMRIFQDYCRACVISVTDGFVGIWAWRRRARDLWESCLYPESCPVDNPTWLVR